jgi:DNA invertase Pin-like site-specific DNA recombinase
MRQMFGAIAEYEKTMIVAKLKAARQRKRIKTGRCEGRKPFGVEQARHNRPVKELAARGLNYTHIANALNGEGLKTRTGSTWFPTTVSRTLARLRP